MTPAAAKAQLELKNQDKQWRDDVYNKKGSAYAEWDRLTTLAAQAPRG